MARYFTKTHQWFDDGSKEVGITPYAAEALGEISFVDLEGISGASLEQIKMSGDEPASDPIDATIESSKAVGDIYSPVSGTVTAINEDLMDEPEKINEDAFAAWLFKIDPSNWDAEKGNLLDEAAYNDYVKTLE
ncbi:MAG: glycine cleavage system protein H [Promethearchaeota archaeon]|nr:MAG: glycine cleavage system protein H [Candidatus Lokiarchaeota archaeon]